MKLFIVHTFTSSERINVFHYCMFHGECDDNESQKPLPSHEIGDDLSKPLSLRRNGRLIPDVFKVAASLVISSTVKETLGELSNVFYLPVIFRKLVDYPYQAGDFSYFETADFRRNPRANDPETLIERLPDVPALHERIGPYFELVNGNYHTRVKEKYPNRRQLHFAYPYLGGLEPAVLEVTDQMLTDFPIMWAEGGFVFVEKVFAKIRRYFDLDYFTITEISFDTRD